MEVWRESASGGKNPGEIRKKSKKYRNREREKEKENREEDKSI